MGATTEVSRRDPEFLRLPDGRRLAWYECGDPEGVPCIYSPGSPVSGLAGLVYDQPARRASVRWISVDRPGFGHSDYQPKRRIVDYPTDIQALTDHLELDRFASVGESGGGPFALVLARTVPRRLLSTTVLAGMGPGDQAWVRQEMKPENRRLLALAGSAPWLLWIPLSRMGRQLADPSRGLAFARKQMAASPAAERAMFESDPTLLELAVAAGAQGYRDRAKGAVQEMALLARPWGFSPREITTHVELWHGTDDASVPVEIARRVAGSLPDCSAHIVEGAGHAVGLQLADEILRGIARG